MSRTRLDPDLLSPDEEDDSRTLRSNSERSRSPGSSGEDELAEPGSAQERKRAALFPPISSICQALGGYEEFTDKDGNIHMEYSLGDQVVGCLKDLKRFWRMDEKDDDRTVARIFYDVGVLKNDLIPILFQTIGTGSKGDRIALACVELIGAMTWPINVAEELRDAQLLDELHRSIDYASLINAQLAYKAVILRTGALRPMFQLMSSCLEKSRRDRSPKDENIISLVLHTFRNLAALKDKLSSSTSADAIEMSALQSDYIVQLASEHIFDLLIAIAHNAESSEYAPWNMVALDIFHLLFRAVKPSELVTPAKKIEDNKLKDLLDLEGKTKLSVANTSRHSRFGTTVALVAGDKKYILHKQSTLAVGPEKTLDKVKKSRAKKVRQDDDLIPPAHLRPEAIKCLHAVALSFLDSAFNPFFASILKDIRMERLKVKETDTIRYLFLARFFLEFFLLVYHQERKAGIDPQSEEGHDFECVAEVVDAVPLFFILAKMKVALEDKPPQWTEVHAGVDCLVQILLVIEAMAGSPSQEHIDAAELLQNKLYYDADNLDLVPQLINKYKQQSHAYLDAILHLAYVLLRMLEKYSKSKSYMFVRRKKAHRGGARPKPKKKNAEDEEGDGVGQGDSEEDEIEQSALSFSEHQFQLTKYEDKFLEESILATYMLYLAGYDEFKSVEQMKRIVGLMHRQAIKGNADQLFWKPSVFELFQSILEDPKAANHPDSAYRDLKKLIEFILRKFFKTAQEYPMLILESFFPKNTAKMKKVRDDNIVGGQTSALFDPYASSEEDGLAAVLASKGVQEVEVTPGFSLTQQIGIAMRCLTDAGKEELITAVQKNLTYAAAIRTEIVLQVDGDVQPIDDDDDSAEAIRRKMLRLQGPSDAAKAKFEPFKVSFDSEDAAERACTDQHFRLLVRLLEWDSSTANPEEPTTLEWAIPVSRMPKMLESDMNIIENFLLDPVDPANGKTAAELLRKKRKPVVRKRRVRASTAELSGASSAETELDENGEKVVKVRKAKKKRAPRRKRAGEDGESGGEGATGGSGEQRKRRSKKREEEAVAYHTAQFIHDSDEDDDAADAAFFAREAEWRRLVNAGAISAAPVDAPAGSKKAEQVKAKAAATPRTVVKRTRAPLPLPDTDLDQQEQEDADSESDETDESEQDEPASSASLTKKRARSVAESVTSASPVVSKGPAAASSDVEMSDEEPAAAKGKKRRVVVESDEDDE